MSNIIKFDDNMKLPAHLRDLADKSGMDEWGSGQVSGFPVLSIKGKVFHIVRGDDAELITRPDDPDEAATSLQLVILKTHKGVARTYYADKYEEGSKDKPLCYSNDGVVPADDAEEKQAKKCAICVHSQWGSRITDNGKKGKACSEVKRLAVAEPGYEDDPMLMRIPPTSLRNWDDYLRKLAKKGLNPSMVVTKVGFDATVSHQLFTFKPTGFLGEESADKVAEMQDDSVVAAIIGSSPILAVEPDDDDEPATAPKERQRATRKPEPEEDDEPEEKPARRRKPAPEPEEEDDEPAPRKTKPAPEPEEEKPARRRRRVVEDEEDEPAPRKAKPAPEPEEEDEAPRRRRRVAEEDDEPEEKPAKSAAKSATVVDADDDLEGELDSMLDDLGFDD